MAGDGRPLSGGERPPGEGGNPDLARLAKAGQAIATAAVSAATGGLGGVAKMVALRVAVPIAGLVLLLAGMFVIGATLALPASGTVAPGNGSVCVPAGGGAGQMPPSKLVPIYQRAAAAYKLGPQDPVTGVYEGWAYLAGINRVETDFGTNLAVSSAGAIGWMQFEPGTWAKYAVDGDGDGIKNPYDPSDAIYSAANVLQASGAPGDWHAAIFAYNHAGWYVNEVESYAHQYLQWLDGDAAGCAGNISLVRGSGLDPIPGFQPGRDDMGVDACAAAGQPIIAPVASTLVEVVQNWYQGQPLMLFRFNQPLAGTLGNDQYWYVAEEIDPVTTQTPMLFQAGQVVARFAPAGTCIEIGWGDPGSTSRTLADVTDPAASHPPARALTVWGETFKKFFGIPWVGTSP